MTTERSKNPYQRRAKAPAAGAPEGPERRGLRQLPKDFADLADGKVERLRRPPRAQPALDDDRVGFVVPGVRNQDARTVYDARVQRLRAAVARDDSASVEDGLCDAIRLTLWRARNVTDFAAFAESVVGVKPQQAETLARKGAERAGVTLDMLPTHVVALWMRAEAALAQSCPDARVAVAGQRDALQLDLHIPVKEVGRAVEGLFDLGGSAAGLRRFLRPDAEPARGPSGPRGARDSRDARDTRDARDPRRERPRGR